MGAHWNLLLPAAERLEPPHHSSAANLSQPTALPVDHPEWPDPHAQLDVRAILCPGMVGNHDQLPDGWGLQTNAVHRVPRQAQLHIPVSVLAALLVRNILSVLGCS